MLFVSGDLWKPQMIGFMKWLMNEGFFFGRILPKCRLEMIQKNFNHYASIHGFIANTFRNDYALTLALRIVNGHMQRTEDNIPWNLVHVGKNTNLYADSKDPYNTRYTVLFDHWQRGKIRKEYITLEDSDFHVMNKQNFLDLIT